MMFYDLTMMKFALLSTFIFVVNSNNLSLFWRINEWNKCLVNSGGCNKPGTRTRKLTCYDSYNKIIPNKICERNILIKPKTVEECLPHLCLASLREYLLIKQTDWSKCEYTSSKELKTIQPRIATNKTSCGENSTVFYVRRRNFVCVIKYPSSSSFEVNSCACSRMFGIKTVEWKFCFFTCIHPCTLSDWSKWKFCKQCRNPNKKYKTRHYTSLPSEHLKAACPQIIKIKVKQNSIKKIKKLQFRISSWGKGKLIRNNKSKGAPNFAVKERNVSCLNKEQEQCNINVPLIKVVVSDSDCILSPWSKLSFCIVNSTNAFGFKYRVRNIKLLPLGIGKPCRHLKEKRKCRLNNLLIINKEYSWLVGEWSICTVTTKTPSKGFNCNIGYIYRSIFCVNNKDFLNQPVSDHFCSSFKKKPIHQRICSLQCREKCVYKRWSVWMSCEDNVTYRVKEPVISFSNTVPCTHIIQKKICISNNVWRTKIGTKCLLEKNSSICGNGYLHHTVQCVNKQNVTINLNNCDISHKPSEYTTCHIPCQDHKCAVSPWMQWSLCFNGVSTRKRYIVYNKNESISCPVLNEPKKCLSDNYFWYYLQWESCITNKTPLFTNKCTLGYQQRQVLCLNNTSNPIHESYCRRYIKPKTEKRCRVCKADCVVSPWSAWQPPCLAVCSPSNPGPKTIRKRFIIKHGTKYGKQCPDNLVESIACKPCADFRWVTEKWEVCLLTTVHTTTATELKNGIQVRGVYCSNGYDVVDDSMCLTQPKPIPSRECFINWLKTCNIKPWSTWTACTKSCSKGIQERIRSFTSNGCETTENESTFVQTRLCNTQICHKYFTQLGKWGNCHPTGPPKLCSSFTPFTLLGVQYRNISCITLDGIPVPLRYCEERRSDRFEEMKYCVIPCTQNCRLSSWSAFTTCSYRCGAGITVRKRYVLHPGNNGGVQCPLTHNGYDVQIIPCKIEDCYDFKWHIGIWSQCGLPNRNDTCHNGKRTRFVKCLKESTGEASISCGDEIKPATAECCEMYNENRWLLTDWTPWSTCTKPCNNKVSSRSRTILLSPKQLKKVQPVLNEQKTCQNCFKYSWILSRWSTCVPIKETVFCGGGVKKRLADCLRSDNTVVNPKYCKKLSKPLIYRTCVIPCKQDCKVSSWSQWSSCDQNCNTMKHRKRERFIVSEDTHGGVPCNSIKLRESLQCIVYPCFTLSVEKWGSCMPLYENSCGVGIQERKAACTRSDGNKVDLSYCLDVITGRTQLKRDCVVPCWNDCITTPWASWSSCFGVCSYDNKLLLTHGYRIRSKYVIQNGTNTGISCPNILTQKEECLSPSCFTFNLTEKSTKCRRSDGIIVSHGCEKIQKRVCKCPLKHAKCEENNYCECDHGYVPVYTEHIVTQCVLIPRLNDQGDEKKLDLPVVIWVATIVCVAYFMLFVGIVILYKSHRTKATRRCSNSTSFYDRVTTTTCDDTKEQHLKTIGRPRQLLTSLAINNSCSSGISSAGVSKLQWPTDFDDTQEIV